MKRRWDEVQYAYHVPEELRRRIGQTPVFEAGKPLKFASFTIFLFGMLVGLLAVIMLGLALADGVGKAGWEITLLRGAAGILLGWAAWWILAGWHRERSVRAACEREYREHGIFCQARVVFFEMTGLGGGDDTDFYIYYQFRDDFIIKEQMDDSNPRKVAEAGDHIQISYLPRDVRISRIATWK
jgi:hypothetical protein